MAEKIRILNLVYSFDIEGGAGGIGRFVTALCRTLDPQDYSVSIGALWHTGLPAEDRWIEELNDSGIPAFTAAQWDGDHPYDSFLRSLRGLRAHLQAEPVDIVHSHSEFSDVAALLLRGFRGHPVAIRTIHYGFRVEWRNRPLRRIFLTNLLYPLLFSAEVGVSQAVTASLNRRIISRLFHRSAQCVYNAVDLKRFQNVHVDRRAKKLSLGVPPDAPLIGSIGRLTEQKGFRYLIEAAAHVQKAIPEARYLIVGDGELFEELQDLARVHNLDRRLFFTGPRKDVEEILPCLDLFVSSSLWEGLPTVILESMASRVPVVATDIPGTRELVVPGETGWLAPPGDGQALASVILEALSDCAGREKAAAKAAENLGRFSIESVAEQYRQIYKNILKV